MISPVRLGSSGGSSTGSRDPGSHPRQPDTHHEPVPETSLPEDTVSVSQQALAEDAAHLIRTALSAKSHEPRG